MSSLLGSNIGTGGVMFVSIMPLVYFQFGLSPTGIGLMFLIPSAVIIVIAPLIGHFIDRYHVSTIFNIHLN